MRPEERAEIRARLCESQGITEETLDSLRLQSTKLVRDILLTDCENSKEDIDIQSKVKELVKAASTIEGISDLELKHNTIRASLNSIYVTVGIARLLYDQVKAEFSGMN